MPDPEDSVDEPSDESAADDLAQDDDDTGRHLGAGQAADAPGSFSDYRGYADAGHYADEEHFGGGEDDHADEDFPAGDDRHPDEDHFAAGEEPYPADRAFAVDAADEYPEFSPRPASAVSSDPPAPPPPLFRGGHRGLGDWRGGHRSDGGRRGVSIGVIVALVAVVVVVGTVILWSFFGDALSHRSHNAAARCVGGKETVAVIVDPSLAEQVQQFAESYNSSAGPVGDHCMEVNVKPAGSDAVVAGFIGKWPGELGGQPALWIPGSSVSAARLAAAAGQKTISDSRSLVSSPVMLAIRPELQPALANQSWATLPGLQTNPNALAGLNLPAWGSLRLALPTNGNSDAAYLAGEAVAAASAPAGAPATQGTAALRTLTSAQPKLADNSLTEAMNALLKPGDVATAPVHAVVTTEQQLFQHGQSLSDAKNTLGSWLPPGPAAVADYPTVLLSGSWLSHEQTSAASEFTHFMRRPEQLAKLAKAGFRVNGVKPPSSAVTSFAALPSTLSVGDDTMRATLADAMAAPSSGLAATILLDQSMPTDEGGKTRLANVVAALNDRIKALPPTAVVGLWTFDGHEGRSEIAAGPLSDTVNGQPRSAALTAALDKQYSSAGGAVSFTTLRMLYQEMQAKYVAGQPNSLLVITAGPHTDQTLDGPGLQNFIRTSADPAKPIAVNVIDFGADPDRATWEAVAQLSGGSYQNLSTSASPDLATAINQYLG
jgi:Bacterial extracellular solute-binding protein